MIKLSKKHKHMLTMCAKFLIPALIIAIIWFGCTMKRDADALNSTGRGALGGAAAGAATGGIFGGPAGAGIGAGVGLVTGTVIGSEKDRSRRRRYDDGDKRERSKYDNRKDAYRNKKNYRNSSN